MRHKHTVLFACACAFTALLSATTLHADPGPDPPTTTTTTEETPVAVDLTLVRRSIQRTRHEMWHWQRVMGRPLTRDLSDPPADPGQRLRAWRELAAKVRQRAQNPPHKRAWLCIHHFEGAWHDPNAPYY